MVAEGHKYVVRTADGRQTLVDLARDPTESSPTSPPADSPWLERLGKAHGMAVGWGWRLPVGHDTPRTIELPAPATAVGVVDPEAARIGRANEGWGETPPHTPDDVATVTLDNGGRTLRLDPGTVPGTVWIRFAEPVAPVGLDALHITEGPVLDPPPGEVERMTALGDDITEAGDEERALLERLGYLTPEEGDDGE